MSAKRKTDQNKAIDKGLNDKVRTEPAAVKATNKAQVENVRSGTDLFDKLGNKTALLALALLLLTGIIVFKDYLFFQNAYFFKDIGSDSYNYSYPFLYSSADYIHQYGIPKWSFKIGMGKSVFPFVLQDPFDIFLYLFGKSHIIFGMAYKEFAKIILGGITFYYYLRTLKLSSFTSIVGSMLFAFCGFTILGSGWFIFSFESFNMALLLLSIEQLLTKGKWQLFPIAIFLICISQPFNLYVYGVFLALYVILRHIQTNSFTWKNIGLFYAKLAGLGFLGMLLSAPFFIENVVQLLESPRGSGNTSYTHILAAMPMFNTTDQFQLGTCVMRFFSSDLLGTGSDFKGWQNYLEAPIFYCGIPCLLLLPQAFQFLDKKVKIAFGIFLAVWTLPIIFPYFRYAFWLFAGDYYRAYSFLVAFTFIFFSVHALDQIVKKRKINLVVLIATVIALFILLNYPFFPDRSIINAPVMVVVSILLLVYGLLLFMLARQNSAPNTKYIFLVVVFLELIYLSGITVNDRNPVTAAELSQKTGYNDYTVEALDYIKHNDKNFYRIDKSYASSPAMHYSLNDAMAQGYYGTSAYNSFNQEYFIKYLQLVGISEKENEIQSRWANSQVSRPILESQNSVKYILAKKNIQPVWKLTCDSIATFGDVRVYRNKFLLPFGYTYSHYIKESTFDKLSPVQKDFVSLRSCVIGDNDLNKVEGLKEFNLADTISPAAFNADVYRQYVNELSKDTLVISKFDENSLTGKISADENKMMYLSIPYDAGWSLKVDGMPKDKIILSAGMTGVFIPKGGTHTIEMTYDLRYFRKGLILCLLGIFIYAALWVVMKRFNKKEQAEQ